MMASCVVTLSKSRFESAAAFARAEQRLQRRYRRLLADVDQEQTLLAQRALHRIDVGRADVAGLNVARSGFWRCKRIACCKLLAVSVIS